MSKEYAWVFSRSDNVNYSLDLAHGIDAIAVKYGYGHLVEVLGNLHYLKRRVASGFMIVAPNKDERERKRYHEEILYSINKLKEFVNYQTRQLFKFFNKNRRDILFYFPIVVFDGEIFEARFTKGELCVAPIQRTVLETRNVSSLTGRLSPMYIDVVSKTQINALLSLIESDVNNVVDRLSNRKLQMRLSAAVLGKGIIPRIR
jgi:hypothetical protein